MAGAVAALYGALTPTKGTSYISLTEEESIAAAKQEVERRQELASKLTARERQIIKEYGRVSAGDKERKYKRRVYKELIDAADPDILAYDALVNHRFGDAINVGLAYRFAGTRLGIPADSTGQFTNTGKGFNAEDYKKAAQIINGFIDPSKPYALGGIVRGPTRALIGEAGPEAVVPLPNGRSIPVTIEGGSMGSTVTVNITQNFEGTITPDDAQEAARAAAREVQRALLPGGIGSR